MRSRKSRDHHERRGLVVDVELVVGIGGVTGSRMEVLGLVAGRRSCYTSASCGSIQRILFTRSVSCHVGVPSQRLLF